MLDPNDLMFLVGDDGEVSLCLGPVSIEVCAEPSEFPDFISALTDQLHIINDEMQANYGDLE